MGRKKYIGEKTEKRERDSEGEEKVKGKGKRNKS